MGYYFAMSECFGCKQLFSYNPHSVPSIAVDGVRQPVCRTCIERANPIRRERGLPEIIPAHDAYEAAKEFDDDRE